MPIVIRRTPSMYERGLKHHLWCLPLLMKKVSLEQTLLVRQNIDCIPASNIFYGPCGECQTESQAAVYKRRFSSPFWLLFENGIFAFHCTTHLSTRPFSLKNYKGVRNLLSIFKVMRKYFNYFYLYQFISLISSVIVYFGSRILFNSSYHMYL